MELDLDHVQSLEMMTKLLFQEENGSAIWQTKIFCSFLNKQLESNAQLGDIMVLSTLSDNVLINKPYAYETLRIQPNNHIEADTRIFLHFADAAHAGHTKA